MTLREHIAKLEPQEEISLCYENQWHTERGNKVYDAFFVGNAKDAPAATLNKVVIEDFYIFYVEYAHLYFTGVENANSNNSNTKRRNG